MRQRGLLLDRDGVINVDHGYVATRERFDFTPGVFPFLRAAQDCGYRLAIVTNQSGVARGLATRHDYERLTAWMLEVLRGEGVTVGATLACFEHDAGVDPALCRASFWRKPNPGMILEAALRLNLDLARSALIGDQARDMQAAQAAGVGTCLWLTEKDASPLSGITVVSCWSQILQALDTGSA